MCQSLPADILARLSALGTELTAWARDHRGASPAAQEAAVLGAVRGALPDLLGAVVQLTTPDLEPAIADVQRRCPGCDQRTPMLEARTRTLQTTCGPITYARPYYPCPRCHHGFAPADAVLGIPPATRYSPALLRWLVRLGATTTHREAAALLTDLTGLRVAAATIRRHSTAAGTALAEAEELAIVQVAATREAVLPVDAAPGTLVAQVDGLMIRFLDGWHEVKLGTLGGTAAEDGSLTALSYTAARASAEDFGPRLLAEAARRGALEVIGWEGGLRGARLAVLRPVHLLGDGAVWIWNLAAEHFGDRTEAVDFYHGAEHLWAVARACFGDGTPEAAAWAQTQRTALRDVGVAPVRAALADLQPTTAEARETLRRERGYFATNAARMDYPGLRAQGLPIGSGAVESAAKHVIQLRMKRPGQRWSDHGGRAMLALRTHHASGRPLLSSDFSLH